MSNYKKQFADYLRSLRESSGLSINDLDRKSGVSSAYISRIENGIRDIPSPDILRKLASPLGVSYQDLMEKAGYLEGIEIVQTNQDQVNELKKIIKKLAAQL